MATLTRVFAKLFGGTADPSNNGEIGQFGSAKSGAKLNTADVATIQALSAYDKGWSAAVVSNRNFPPIEEVTGVLKTLSYQICYGLQEGVATWDSQTEYSATSIVKSFSGNTLTFYKSKSNGNINHSVTDDDYWTPAIIVGERGIGVPQITLNFSGSLPANCIELKGQAVSRTTYNNLFAIYGTTYGSGDGSTTFNLPNFSNRAIYGGTAAGYISAGLPNITATTGGAGSHTHTVESNGNHTHTKGSMKIYGNITSTDDNEPFTFCDSFSATGALTLGSRVTEIGGISGGAQHGAGYNTISFDSDRTSSTWTGSTSTNGSHSHSLNTVSNHTHSVSVSMSVSGILNNSSTVQPPAIKVRVYTRYQ